MRVPAVLGCDQLERSSGRPSSVLRCLRQNPSRNSASSSPDTPQPPLAHLVKRIARIPGVTRTQTSTVLNLLKNVYRWDVLLAADDDPQAPPARTEAAGPA